MAVGGFSFLLINHGNLLESGRLQDCKQYGIWHRGRSFLLLKMITVIIKNKACYCSTGINAYLNQP